MTNDADNADTPIRLVDLPGRLPPRPDRAKVDFSTVWGWVTEGPESDRLATFLIDDIPYTTPAAVDEFLAGRRRQLPRREQQNFERPG